MTFDFQSGWSYDERGVTLALGRTAAVALDCHGRPVGVLEFTLRRDPRLGSRPQTVTARIDGAERAALTLARPGVSEAEVAVPALLLATDHPDVATRVFAQGALAMLGLLAEESAQFLEDYCRRWAPEYFRLLPCLRSRLSAVEAAWVSCLLHNRFLSPLVRTALDAAINLTLDQQAAVEALTRSLTNKLLHPQLTALRESTRKKDTE